MAATLNVPLFLPPGYARGSMVAYAFSIAAATDQLAFIFQAPNVATILTKAVIRWGAKTGTPPVYRLSLQGVGTDGNPDGTIKHDDGGTNDVTVDLPTASRAGLVAEYTFANHYHAAAGEMLALVIDTVNTPDGSNFWSFTRGWSNTGVHLPHASQYTGSWAKQIEIPCFAVGDGTSWWGGSPASVVNEVAFGSSPVCAGNKFTLPAGMGDTVSCPGFWFYLKHAGGKSIRVSLYDDADNVLAQLDFDSDVGGGTTTAYPRLYRWDDASVSLSCGSTYRLVATEYAASTASAHKWTFLAAAHKDAWMPFGQIPIYTYGSAGSWTDDALSFFNIGPIISDITEPAGGGGGPVIGSRIVRGLGAL